MIRLCIIVFAAFTTLAASAAAQTAALDQIVAAAADRFVVIVSADKLVERLRPPVPLELERFGLAATLRELKSARLRTGALATPDRGVLADYVGIVDDEPGAVATWLDSVPGVVGHGLFGPELVGDVIVGRGHPPQG